MDADEIKHIQALLETHKRNLRRAELQSAQHGTDVPIKTQNEIDIYKEQIHILMERLNQTDEHQKGEKRKIELSTSINAVGQELNTNINTILAAYDISRARIPFFYIRRHSFPRVNTFRPSIQEWDIHRRNMVDVMLSNRFDMISGFNWLMGRLIFYHESCLELKDVDSDIDPGVIDSYSMYEDEFNEILRAVMKNFPDIMKHDWYDKSISIVWKILLKEKILHNQSNVP